MDYPISAERDHMRGLCTLPFLRSHLWLYVIWLFIVDFLFGCPLKPGEANVTCYFSRVGQDPGPWSILSCKCFLLLAPGRCFFFCLASSYFAGHFSGDSDGKVSACNAGDPGSVPGWGRSPGEGNGNPLQYSCLENSMDRGAL